MQEQREFLTVREFGELIGVKEARANEIVHELGIAVRIGQRRLLVPRRAIDALIESAVLRVQEQADDRTAV